MTICSLQRWPTIGASGLAVAASAHLSVSALAVDSTSKAAASKDSGTLVIKGSRLKSGFDRPSPVAVIGAEQLEAQVLLDGMNRISKPGCVQSRPFQARG